MRPSESYRPIPYIWQDFQERDNLFHFLFCACQSCHILECDLHVIVLVEQLRLGLAYAEYVARPAATASGHPPHEENPDKDEEEDRAE